MPTGYTAAIAKGISFEEYVWSCARAFGALVMMRDDPTGAPIPQRFEPSDHHALALAKAKADRDRVAAMTEAECEREAAVEYARDAVRYAERVAEKRGLREKYLAMRAKAEAWNPPSKDHEGLKDFMVKQINDSIEWDCDERYMDTAPPRLTASDWRARQLDVAEKNIQYHHDENAKEIARTESRNVWLMALRASVPPGVPSDMGIPK